MSGETCLLLSIKREETTGPHRPERLPTATRCKMATLGLQLHVAAKFKGPASKRYTGEKVTVPRDLTGQEDAGTVQIPVLPHCRAAYLARPVPMQSISWREPSMSPCEARNCLPFTSSPECHHLPWGVLLNGQLVVLVSLPLDPPSQGLLSYRKATVNSHLPSHAGCWDQHHIKTFDTARCQGIPPTSGLQTKNIHDRPATQSVHAFICTGPALRRGFVKRSLYNGFRDGWA